MLWPVHILWLTISHVSKPRYLPNMSSIDKTKEPLIGIRDSGCWDNNVSLVLLIGFVNKLIWGEIQYVFSGIEFGEKDMSYFVIYEIGSGIRQLLFKRKFIRFFDFLLNVWYIYQYVLKPTESFESLPLGIINMSKKNVKPFFTNLFVSNRYPPSQCPFTQ